MDNHSSRDANSYDSEQLYHVVHPIRENSDEGSRGGEGEYQGVGGSVMGYIVIQLDRRVGMAEIATVEMVADTISCSRVFARARYEKGAAKICTCYQRLVEKVVIFSNSLFVCYLWVVSNRVLLRLE